MTWYYVTCAVLFVAIWGGTFGWFARHDIKSVWLARRRRWTSDSQH